MVPSNQTPTTAKPSGKPEKELHIQIDRSPYQVLQLTMSGAEIRQLPTPPIGTGGGGIVAHLQSPVVA